MADAPGEGYAWTRMASVDADGGQGNGGSYGVSISADNRYVAFYSYARNLVASDTNWQLDVFVKDLQTGAIQRVSVAADGGQGNNSSMGGDVSTDGRYVAFCSLASNLVANDTNGVYDVFVKDTQTGAIQRVSVAADGVQGNDDSKGGQISADGRYVTFISYARNLVASDTNWQLDVFVKDLQTGAIQRVSVAADGGQGNNASDGGSISPDGRYVAFLSYASNLVANDTNGQRDVFVKDLQTGAIQRVSVAADGGQGNNSSMGGHVSFDGHYVGFHSLASNLVADDTNGQRDVFVKDLQTGAIQRVSVAADGVQGNNKSEGGTVSTDRRYVAFTSEASNLVANDTNGAPDIFIKDLQTGAIQRVSVAADGGQGNGNSYESMISNDGSYVVFRSEAGNLVASDTNSQSDVFFSKWGSLYDTIAPQITNTQPTGRQSGNNFTIEADFSDAESGIDPASIALVVNHNGRRDVTAEATITDGHISYSGSGRGMYNVGLLVKDNAGNEQVAQWDFDLPDISYFPWYDSKYGRTWVLMAQPLAGSVAAQSNVFDVYLKTLTEPLSLISDDVSVASGETQFRYYGGKIGGPVKVTADGTGLVSERSLFGNSFEEVWGMSFDELDSHYWWPVYDSSGPMRNWILIANPPENAETVRARVNIYKNGQVVKTDEREIAAGDSWAPIYTGFSGGPVEVIAWREDGIIDNPDDARKVIATQRVLFNGAFNEMPGIAASRLDSSYMWTWYDDRSPGASNWVVITNPNPYDIIGAVIVGDMSKLSDQDPGNDPYVYSDWIGPRQNLVIRDEQLIGGPVFAFGCSGADCSTPEKIVTSQRLLWGPSFGEIAGTADWEISFTTANWTWYDQKSPGVKNWVLVSNPMETPIYAEIRIASQTRWSGVIEPYQNKTPTFPGTIGGPVEVEAWVSNIDPVSKQQKKDEPALVFASQRVLWNGYFNEIVGKGL